MPLLLQEMLRLVRVCAAQLESQCCILFEDSCVGALGQAFILLKVPYYICTACASASENMQLHVATLPKQVLSLHNTPTQQPACLFGKSCDCGLAQIADNG